MSLFKKATKSQIKLRLALTGPSGSGKTFSSKRDRFLSRKQDSGN